MSLLSASRYPFLSYKLLIAACTLGILTAGKTALACSLCGCSLSSDWSAQGYNVKPGTEVSVRYEYNDQSQLRSGTDTVNTSQLSLPNDREIQQKTLTRSIWLGADYVPKNDWGIGFQLPYHNRFHTTIAPGDIDLSSSKAKGIGDLRVMGRYQAPVQLGNWGIQGGLKLPTGRFSQTFATGPQSGNELDRGLQLGTGTTDVVLGVSHFGRVRDSLGYFAQAIFQKPVTERSGFLPSTSLNANIGIRWLNTSHFLPQLQLNARWDGREKGRSADFDNSGATIVDLSPGVSVEITRRSSAFGFVQIPVFQRVNGLQLEPRWQLSIGYRHAL